MDERRDDVAEPGRPRSTKSLVRGAAGAVLFSALAIFLIMRLTGGREGLSSLFRVDRVSLATAGLLVVVGWVLEAARIETLVRALGGKLGFTSALRIALAGAFVACVTPFDTGGEPLQVYLLHRHGIGAGESTAVIAVKTIVSSLARLALALIFPVWYIVGRRSWDLPGGLEVALFVGLVLYILVLTLIGFFVLYPESVGAVLDRVLRNKYARRLVPAHAADSFLEKVKTEVRDFRAAFRTFVRERRPALVAISILSLLSWAMVFFIPVLVLRGLGVDPPFAQTMGVAGIFYLAAAYAPTPGSSGAAEASLAVLFGSIVPFRLLGVFVLLWRGLTYYLTLLVGAVAVAASYLHGRTRRDDGRGKSAG
ncbi:MAG: flippase-like domain-containing protein [Firmicutes bacterium]|nr:flippase-like domain-containing protein [Bacillota bacterium]